MEESRSDSDSNDKRQSKEAGLVIYFTQIGEPASLTETEVSKEDNNEKNNNARISLKRTEDKALTKTSDDKQTGKSIINHDIFLPEDNSAVPIEELPTPMEVMQERKIEERIEMLKINDELEEKQVGQVKAVLKQGRVVFAQSI
ncbi:7628_t:CDS:1 [Acaulospora morrowiae]|uniref:7628_t:CDS:1 n=1 Tax=Acaulospora morrowiae TaxID=94023 RepID=A0A9N9G4K7_9GLOM|nr:7628_t:CDS:1 [Acaulospora morrowiae]